MELSNKALAVLLLAAMVVSLGGTIISLNKMNQVEYVGYATSATGTVNLSIGSTKSITTADGNIVNFGTCSISSGITDYVNSEMTDNTTTRCPSYTQSNISVRNDGNSNVSVTMQFSNCGPGYGNASCTFLDTSSATLSYRTTSSGRGGNSGGCTSGPVTTYTPVNTTAAGLPACTLLEAVGAPGANSFVTNFRIGIPSSAPTGYSNVTITYTAS